MKRLPTQAAANYARRKGWIDVPGGLALMRDPSVPMGLKTRALGLGVLLMLLVQALELPIEGLLDAMTGFLATPILFAVDGLEFLVLPVLFGAAILARTARPKARM